MAKIKSTKKTFEHPKVTVIPKKEDTVIELAKQVKIWSRGHGNDRHHRFGSAVYGYIGGFRVSIVQNEFRRLSASEIPLCSKDGMGIGLRDSDFSLVLNVSIPMTLILSLENMKGGSAIWYSEVSTKNKKQVEKLFNRANEIALSFIHSQTNKVEANRIKKILRK